MPTRRTGGGSRLKLADLTFNERFSFLSPWWRPGSKETRWSTWAEYFHFYEAVRPELLPRRKWLPFAEFALPIFRAGGDPLDARPAFDQGFRQYRQKGQYA